MWQSLCHIHGEHQMAALNHSGNILVLTTHQDEVSEHGTIMVYSIPAQQNNMRGVHLLLKTKVHDDIILKPLSNSPSLHQRLVLVLRYSLRRQPENYVIE